MSADIARLFRSITTGVYVVGVAHGGRRNAFTAAWLVQVSFEPLLLGLSVNPDHASYPLLMESGRFAVSVLRDGQMDLARHFGTQSGREVDKLAAVAWRPGAFGAPVLVDALAYFECAVAGRLPAGDHDVVLGRVTGGGVLSPGASPLLYAETGDLDGSRELYPTTFA